MRRRMRFVVIGLYSTVVVYSCTSNFWGVYNRYIKCHSRARRWQPRICEMQNFFFPEHIVSKFQRSFLHTSFPFKKSNMLKRCTHWLHWNLHKDYFCKYWTRGDWLIRMTWLFMVQLLKYILVLQFLVRKFTSNVFMENLSDEKLIIFILILVIGGRKIVLDRRCLKIKTRCIKFAMKFHFRGFYSTSSIFLMIFCHCYWRLPSRF